MNDRVRKRATCSKLAINGIEKLLEKIQLPTALLADKEIQSALRYLQKTVEIYRTPEAAAKRDKTKKYKQEWLIKKQAAGELPPEGTRRRKRKGDTA